MKLTFHGAAGEVTGSKTLIEAAGSRILLDCGLFQGEGSDEHNRASWPFDPKSIDAVVLTHAHLDHIGLLPRLVRDGYGGPVFATEPTREMCPYMWEDEIKVREQDAAKGEKPLFEREDLEATRQLIQGVKYGESVRVAPGVDVVFREVGHVLGSSFVEIRAEGKVLVGSGDVGNDDVPILRDTEPLGQVDAIILESTYGDRNHEGGEDDRRDQLLSALKQVASQKSVLLIPAFSLERTQEILYELNGLVEGGAVPKLPIFLDSPLATRLLPVFRDHPECYDNEARIVQSMDGDLFRFPGLKVIHEYHESLEIDGVRSPKVIVAGSGMMSGGRIVRHLGMYLGDEKNLLLVIGYQGRGTLGRAIVDGAETVLIDNEEVAVRAEVRQVESFSAHADRDKLLRWLGTAENPPQHVFLNHGEPAAAESLAAAIREKELAEEVEVAAPGETYEV